MNGNLITPGCEALGITLNFSEPPPPFLQNGKNSCPEEFMCWNYSKPSSVSNIHHSYQCMWSHHFFPQRGTNKLGRMEFIFPTPRTVPNSAPRFHKGRRSAGHLIPQNRHSMGWHVFIQTPDQAQLTVELLHICGICVALRESARRHPGTVRGKVLFKVIWDWGMVGGRRVRVAELGI